MRWAGSVLAAYACSRGSHHSAQAETAPNPLPGLAAFGLTGLRRYNLAKVTHPLDAFGFYLLVVPEMIPSMLISSRMRCLSVELQPKRPHDFQDRGKLWVASGRERLVEALAP